MYQIKLKFLICEIICIGLLSTAFREYSFLTDIDFLERYTSSGEVNGLGEAHKLGMMNYYSKVLSWVGILLSCVVAVLLSKKLRLKWHYPVVVVFVGLILKIIGFWDSGFVKAIMFFFRNVISALPIIYVHIINGTLLLLIFIAINILLVRTTIKKE